MHQLSAVLLSVAAGQLFGTGSSAEMQSLLIQMLAGYLKIKLTRFSGLQYLEFKLLRRPQEVSYHISTCFEPLKVCSNLNYAMSPLVQSP